MSKKRKFQPSAAPAQETFHIFAPNVLSNPGAALPPIPALFIQAYEAELVKGNEAAGLSLEIGDDGLPGDGLIKWNGVGGKDVFVDRFDARLLLDSLPTHSSSPPSPAGSGWSDLPSDAEDMFFFNPSEVEDFHRDKRRREIDRLREARVNALREERGDDEFPPEEEPWGASDEECTEEQKDLIQRTATHIFSSPNPAVLQMRILANHGGDKRFAFLRGRWSRTWNTAQAKCRSQMEEQKKVKNNAGLSGLADYASDSDQHEEEKPVEPAETLPRLPGISGHEGTGDSALKEARRARAREWSEKRAKLKD